MFGSSIAAAFLASLLPSLSGTSSLGGHAPMRPFEHHEVSIFVLAGQSNAIGFGTNAADLPQELAVAQPHIRFWYQLGSDAAIDDPSIRWTSGGQFVPLAPLADPTGQLFGGPSHGFGSELSLARALDQHVDGEIAILKFCFGATDLPHHWSPSVPTGLYYQMLDEIAAVRARLASEHRTSRVRGFFWVHGENDATDPVLSTLYGVNVEIFVRYLRQDLSEPQLPVIVSRLNAFLANAPGADFDYVPEVRVGQAQAVAQVGSAWLVDTDDLQLAPHPMHFSSAGQVALGARMAQAWRMLARGPVVPHRR